MFHGQSLSSNNRFYIATKKIIRHLEIQFVYNKLASGVIWWLGTAPLDNDNAPDVVNELRDLRITMYPKLLWRHFYLKSLCVMLFAFLHVAPFSGTVRHRSHVGNNFSMKLSLAGYLVKL